MQTETFTIGQVAEITGISRDRLRYYEEKGILHPKQNDENNYREYGYSDIDIILTIEYYRSMDMGMKEISELSECAGLAEIAERLKSKEEDVIKRVEELTGYLANIRKGEEACSKIIKNLNRFSVRHMPAFEVLGELSDYRAFSEYQKIHNKKTELGGTILNSLKRMIVFSGKDVIHSRMLITRDMEEGMKASEAHIMKFKRCLYTVVEDSDEMEDQVGDMYEKSMKWALEHKLSPQGFVIINMLFISVNKTSAKSYLEIFAPVEE